MLLAERIYLHTFVPMDEESDHKANQLDGNKLLTALTGEPLGYYDRLEQEIKHDPRFRRERESELLILIVCLSLHILLQAVSL